MPEVILSFLYRPQSQQWLLFVLLGMGSLVAEAALLDFPAWRQWQRSEVRYLQQSTVLNQKRKKLASLPSLVQLRALCNQAKAPEPPRMTPMMLLARTNVRVRHWKSGSPAQIQLWLNWPEVKDIFGRIASLYPAWSAGDFTLGRQKDVLEMTLWLQTGD